MAKIKFSFHNIAADIREAEKKLRAIRSKVSKADQKRIDLDLRALEKSYRLIRIRCGLWETPTHPPYGLWYTTKPK
jgi:hypothetical protein